MRLSGKADRLEPLRQITSDPCSSLREKGHHNGRRVAHGSLETIMNELRAEFARNQAASSHHEARMRFSRRRAHKSRSGSPRSRSSRLRCDRRVVFRARRADRRRPTDGLRAGGGKVSAEELWGERPHRQMRCRDVGPGDLPTFGERYCRVELMRLASQREQSVADGVGTLRLVEYLSVE